LTRIHIPVHLRWADLDAYNHVNNATMLTLLEEARIRAFWRALPGEDAPPTAVLDPGPASGLLSLIARQEIEYLSPIPYGRHPLDVQMWFGHVGGSSIDVCYEVFSPRETAGENGQALHARALSVLVRVNGASGKPVRLTEEERTAWAPYAGEPLRFTRRR
jgi:acyl-CoA thioester hydrolase